MGKWGITLTAAELRLLPYLATHLTVPDIATRLFVTSHTVRSEAKSIYRKLDASVAHARRSRKRVEHRVARADVSRIAPSVAVWARSRGSPSSGVASASVGGLRWDIGRGRQLAALGGPEGRCVGSTRWQPSS